MKKTARGNVGGYTLIEIIVTIFVVISVMGIYVVFVQMARVTRDQKYQDIALRIAESKVDTLRAGGYAALPATSSFSDTQLNSLPGNAATTTVTAYNATTKQVVVTVAWQEPGKNLRTISLTTLITQSGGL